MNQYDQTCFFTCATARSCGEKEWKLVDSLLDKWQKNVDECIDIVNCYDLKR
jgi:hypothetical protein